MAEAQAVRDLAALFANLALKAEPNRMENGVAKRPGFGMKGEAVKVLANHFKIADLNEQLILCMYDVAIERVKREGAPPPRPSAAGEGPPPMPPKGKCYAILNKLAMQQNWPKGKWAYDGQKQLWTVGSFLPTHEVRGLVPLEDESRRTAAGAAARMDPERAVPTYEVVIKPAEKGVLEVGREFSEYRKGQASEVPRESMQALDVAMRQGATQEPGNRLLGRGIYTPADHKQLGLGLEAWRGYLQSVNTTQAGLTLSMDPAVVAVPVVVDLIVWVQQVAGIPPDAPLAARGLTPQQINSMIGEVTRNTMTVVVTHRSHGLLRHKVRGFTLTSARDSKFTNKEGQQMSVEQYFKQAYNMVLRYPLLPCVVVGSSKKPEWIPVEVCRVAPDPGKRALTGEQTTEILRMSAVNPMERKHKTLETLVRKAKLNVDPTARGFGLNMATDPKMMEVPGRVLPPPRLTYGKDSKGQPISINPGDKGDWNLIRVPLLEPVKLESFAVVCYVPPHRADEQRMTNFLNELNNAMYEKGLNVCLPDWPPVVYRTRNMSDEQALREACRQAEEVLGKPPQVLFVIQEREGQVYNEVKRLCDCVLGVQSQLLVASNIKLLAPDTRGMDRKMAGVVLKLNMKLGGDNSGLSGNIGSWCPALRDANGAPLRVMMLGADVTHPTNLPGQGKTDSDVEKRHKPDQPSIAAVIGSTNLQCTRYAARVMAQNPLQEFVEDMEQAVFELLKLWMGANKTLPDVVLMWRDGVSEGQFRPVLQSELQAIKQACARFKDKSGKPYAPRITFTTVQKRHQTRLYPAEARADDGKTGNVRPGLVVDKEIVHPREFDFYLNSHAGIQGTNKPAKYSVLYDGVGFSADSMQLLVHHLCHNFCRCTRSVSYVTPAYYAHHAAFRGRSWLRRLDMSETGSRGSGVSGPGWTWEFSQPHPAIKDTMFFI